MPIVVISINANTRMGGEAMKAFQFFHWLRERDADAYLLTRESSRPDLVEAFGEDRLLIVEDTPLQKFMFHSRFFNFGLPPYFHMSVGNLLSDFDPGQTVLHYLCPISPVEPRFPVKGFRIVMGPLNGNISHPPGFRDRMSSGKKLRAQSQKPIQRMMGALIGDKRRADVILNSGGDRTRQSLRWAGAHSDRIVDVLDAGVNGDLLAVEPVRHSGRNSAFLCIARLVEYKAIDLAIRALARCSEETTLRILGDGPEKSALLALAAHLGVQDRVSFEGYVKHDRLRELCKEHRALVFPSLAEANGIAMQEAMALGLPVIALRWGGQTALAGAQEAIWLEPDNEESLVENLSQQMTRLADAPDLANDLAARARVRATETFGWDSVAESWTAPYKDLMPS